MKFIFGSKISYEIDMLSHVDEISWTLKQHKMN